MRTVLIIPDFGVELTLGLNRTQPLQQPLRDLHCAVKHVPTQRALDAPLNFSQRELESNLRLAHRCEIFVSVANQDNNPLARMQQHIT